MSLTAPPEQDHLDGVDQAQHVQPCVAEMLGHGKGRPRRLTVLWAAAAATAVVVAGGVALAALPLVGSAAGMTPPASKAGPTELSARRG